MSCCEGACPCKVSLNVVMSTAEQFEKVEGCPSWNRINEPTPEGHICMECHPVENIAGIDTEWTPDDEKALNDAFSGEKIDGPAHYGGKDNVYEAIKVIEAHELGFALGNAVKYILRAGKKEETTEVEDLQKAAWYIERRIKQLEHPEAKWFDEMVEFTSPESYEARDYSMKYIGPLANLGETGPAGAVDYDRQTGPLFYPDPGPLPIRSEAESIPFGKIAVTMLALLGGAVVVTGLVTLLADAIR